MDGRELVGFWAKEKKNKTMAWQLFLLISHVRANGNTFLAALNTEVFARRARGKGAEMITGDPGKTSLMSSLEMTGGPG